MEISSNGEQNPSLALGFSNILCCEQPFPINCLRPTRGLAIQLPAQVRYSEHAGFREGMKADPSCGDKPGPIPRSPPSRDHLSFLDRSSHENMEHVLSEHIAQQTVTVAVAARHRSPASAISTSVLELAPPNAVSSAGSSRGRDR